jgi:hypothetical protein
MTHVVCGLGWGVILISPHTTYEQRTGYDIVSLFSLVCSTFFIHVHKKPSKLQNYQKKKKKHPTTHQRTPPPALHLSTRNGGEKKTTAFRFPAGERKLFVLFLFFLGRGRGKKST